MQTSSNQLEFIYWENSWNIDVLRKQMMQNNILWIPIQIFKTAWKYFISLSIIIRSDRIRIYFSKTEKHMINKRLRYQRTLTYDFCTLIWRDVSHFSLCFPCMFVLFIKERRNKRWDKMERIKANFLILKKALNCVFKHHFDAWTFFTWVSFCIHFWIVFDLFHDFLHSKAFSIFILFYFAWKSILCLNSYTHRIHL